MRWLLLFSFLFVFGFEITAGTHVVKKNETLTAIAKHYGVTVEAIARVNDLKDTDLVVAGRKLTIPEDSSDLSQYVVHKDDTLALIAKKFGLPVSDLTRLNDLKDPNKIQAGQIIQLPFNPYDDISYKVKRGDTLALIATRHGLSTRNLATYNHISEPDVIVVGQELRIPRTNWKGYAGPRLEPVVLRKLNAIHVNSRKWQYIVVHHTGTPYDTPKSIDRYHRNVRHMENGLAYHFVIGNGRNTKDGGIYIGDRWDKQIRGGHLASLRLNEKCIGICLVGNFMNKAPSAKQMDALEALTQYLMEECDIPKSRVTTHKRIHPHHTDCPGRKFPYQSFLASLHE